MKKKHFKKNFDSRYLEKIFWLVITIFCLLLKLWRTVYFTVSQHPKFASDLYKETTVPDNQFLVSKTMIISSSESDKI